MTQVKEKRILVVEDEGDMRLILDIILHNKKTTIDHANNLAKAKEYLAVETPDIIVLDNKLPDGRGLGFVSYIKETKPSTKILMISGDDIAKESSENGVDIFLKKPFSKQLIFDAVEKLFG